MTNTILYLSRSDKNHLVMHNIKIKFSFFTKLGARLAPLDIKSVPLKWDSP
jgi:hypothetical protein